MALSTNQQSSLLAILVAGLLGYTAYTGTGVSLVGIEGVQPRQARAKAIEDSVTLLEAQVDTAKQALASGTVEDLRRRLDGYRQSLELLRRLVPDRNEVPNLLDDISTRAKIRGVNLAKVAPLPPEPGPAPFDTHRYEVSVLGHYDQIGEFLADVASLPRIIVPVDLQMVAANPTAAKALGDSTGALLEAKFLIRTYVKTTNPEGEGSGT
ncbi:MAG TPA: type 4a pilus biogenesis protein PilO [Gemmatimonadales bacterium]|nr:type 4a pilus biogenesis protein PilO [Gemmatimonadales bacterium]